MDNSSVSDNSMLSSNSSFSSSSSINKMIMTKESATSYTSAFKHGLEHVAIPSILLEGVEVRHVQVNGSMREAFLSISSDRFTLYVTTSKRVLTSTSGGGGSTLGSLFGMRRKAPPPVTKSTSSSATSSFPSELEERSIDIGAIDRFQRGQVTHQFELAKKLRQDSRNEEMALSPSKSFSIVFRGARTLDLMVTDENRNRILDALDSVLRAYQEAKLKVSKDVLLLRYVWLDVDKKSKNAITCNELADVLERINCFMKKAELTKMYEKFAKIICLDHAQRRKGLTFEQCATFLHKIKRDSWMVKPVNVIWNDLFGEIMNNGKPRKTVSVQTFLEKFLHRKQGETYRTVVDVQQIFARLHQMEMPHLATSEVDTARIDKNNFEAFLLSPDNDAFDPQLERFDTRLMTRPIAEYWINSSHNTYLTGDQLTSNSSVQMYMDALYRGCRCVELDIWDGELDSTKRPVPVVWHGHTMTSKILFVEILKCLRVFLNFHPDTYPLILSFENHCSLPYQEVIAEDLVRVLGDRLYVPTEASLFGRLPTPEDLRGLVVIKGRRPNSAIDDLESDEDSDDDELASNNGSNLGTERSSRSSTSGAMHNTSSTRPKRVRIKIAPALARLTLFHGCAYKHWDDSVRNPTHHMHSFSETTVKKLCRQSKVRKWAIYNQSHMSRTYPAGSRMDSSNYNPMLAWSTGCQMVALNFQTPDQPLKINDGRFRENGNCGYVLKPAAIMSRDDFSEPPTPTKVSVRILSGSCLPKPKGQRSGDCIDPYVKITMYDVKNEEKETTTTYSSSVVQKNGYFPIWHNVSNKDRFNFIVENGAVAVLQLEVFAKGDMGQSDEFIANAAIPISCLRQGYRSVQLFDDKNTRTGPFDFASLLIETKIRNVSSEI